MIDADEPFGDTLRIAIVRAVREFVS